VARDCNDDATILERLKQWTQPVLSECCAISALKYSGNKALATNLLPLVRDLRFRSAAPATAASDPARRTARTPNTSTVAPPLGSASSPPGLHGLEPPAAGSHAHGALASLTSATATARKRKPDAVIGIFSSEDAVLSCCEQLTSAISAILGRSWRLGWFVIGVSRQRAQQARPHPRRAEHTTWVGSWSECGLHAQHTHYLRGLRRRITRRPATTGLSHMA